MVIPTSSPPFKNQRFLVVLHLVSFALLYTPNGIAWYFGNLVVYINSYWYAKHGSSNLASQWVISTNIIGWGTSVMLAGNVVKKCDRRIFAFLGFLLFDAGIFLSYVTVDKSQIAFILTFGLLTGIGHGFINTEVFTRLPLLVSKRAALTLAFINNCFNLGSVIYDWIATWHINPRNEEADVLVAHHFKVFSDKSLIDRVPDTFIILGIIGSACHFTGFILTAVLNNKGLNATKDIDIAERSSESTSLTVNSEYYMKRETEVRPGKIQTNSLHSIDDTNHPIQSPSQNVKRLSSEICNSNNGDLTPWQMVKTLKFYALSYTVFANEATYMALLNFYKVFGELWINDDHFLTHLGIAALSTVILTRIMWAFILDRSNPKCSQLLVTMSMALTCLWYYFTPGFNKWLFAVWTCIGGTMCCAVYLNFSFMALKLFGQTYYAANYGIISIATVVLNLMAPEVFKAVLHNLGWAPLFIGIGGLNVIAAIFNVIALPNRF